MPVATFEYKVFKSTDRAEREASFSYENDGGRDKIARIEISPQSFATQKPAPSSEGA